jgi:hypothetical protein
LNDIMSDARQSARHRVDAIKTLDQLADPGPSRFAEQQDRFIIRIDLTADTKSKDPADILIFDKSIRPDPPNTIDATPAQVQSIPELPPVRRGPGRPKGSKNKPKTVDAEELLPFVAAKQSDGGGSGQPI